MRDVAEILVPWALSTLALFSLLDWDESRLTPDALDRAWPPSTRTLALVYFGALALPIHFWRTRRTKQGFLIGVGALVVGFALYWAAGEGVDVLPESAMSPLTVIVMGAFVTWLARRSLDLEARRSHGHRR